MSTYRFRELKVPLEHKNDVQASLARALGVPEGAITRLDVDRFALDSRKRGAPHWSYNVRFDCAQAPKPSPYLDEASWEKETLAADPLANTIAFPEKITVVGAGPAGLWTALHFLRRGFKVALHEQGKTVEERFRDIRRFFADRTFNPYSNVLFGEGGAGAFSDGKLNTRTRNAFSQAVLEDMAGFGLSREILSFAKPHVGTDRLVLLLQKVRAEIISRGGELFFSSHLEDIDVTDKVITRAKFNGKWETCGALVIAGGHSARFLYELFAARGIQLESKAFAMGVRVEHPQELINERQLGKGVDTGLTGSAEYSLTAKTLGGKSAAYSFCMCPGGVLVPCASEPGMLATNGMSYSKRSGKLANGAIVVPVAQSTALFGGLEYQRRLERAAFEAGGGNYAAPAQTIEAFMHKAKDRKPLPQSSYPCGITASNLRDWMGAELCDSLAEGFENFERKIPGFIRYGLIVAPETRTSSPLRIVRDSDTLESVSVKGLYVLGEGAGYAGGIVTSAADGVRLANRAKKLHG